MLKPKPNIQAAAWGCLLAGSGPAEFSLAAWSWPGVPASGMGMLALAFALAFAGFFLWREKRARRAAEKALEVRQSIWRAALEDGLGGLWDWDLLSGMVTVPTQFAELLGQKAEDVPTRAAEWQNLLHPDDREPCAAAVAQLLAGQISVFEKECRYRRADGTYVHLLSRARVVEYASDGSPRRVVGSHQNLSPLRRAQSDRQESESRFREIFESSLDSMYVLDVVENGRFRVAAVNPANERHFNLPASEQVGRYSHEVLPPHIREEQLGYYRMCVDSGQSLTIDESAKLNGKMRHWITTLLPVRHEKGHVKRIIGIAHDTTQVKEAELALRTSEQRLREIFEHTSEVIMMYEVDDQRVARVISANPMAERAIGLPQAEILGKTPADFCPPELLPAISEVMERCLITGRNVSYSRKAHLRGQDYHFHSTYIPVRNDVGRIYRLLLIARNLADQRAQDEIAPILASGVI